MKPITSKPSKKAIELEKEAKNLFQNFNISESRPLYFYHHNFRRFSLPSFIKGSKISTYTTNDSKKQLVD